VKSRTDTELLEDYAEYDSEAAFSELVRRHLDFVYSTALRLVRDGSLAEDVCQKVFVALARSARQVSGYRFLSGWLHRTAWNLSANVIRSDVRRRAREQEAAVMNQLFADESEATWKSIAPHLDAALSGLSNSDRDAVLLRYFQQKSAHEMSQVLGISAEAAQKRVNRAVERLREGFNRSGVTIGASGLALLLAANAVQSAPTGFAAAISSGASRAWMAAQHLRQPVIWDVLAILLTYQQYRYKQYAWLTNRLLLHGGTKPWLNCCAQLMLFGRLVEYSSRVGI
jgi:RNA polymerase sigma factor (sigma-70 family)